jgi:hypothetical protein
VVCALSLAFPLALTLLLHVGFRFGFAIQVGSGITGSVLHLAHDFLGLALDLLRGTFDLKVSVIGPLANLALRPSRSVVDCTFYAVLIHDSTSVVFCFGLSTSVYLAGPVDAPLTVGARQAQIEFCPCLGSRLNGPASRDQLDDKHYKRDHEKDVNESAEGV